jgi:hypothetical protein
MWKIYSLEAWYFSKSNRVGLSLARSNIISSKIKLTKATDLIKTVRICFYVHTNNKNVSTDMVCTTEKIAQN